MDPSIAIAMVVSFSLVLCVLIISVAVVLTNNSYERLRIEEEKLKQTEAAHQIELAQARSNAESVGMRNAAEAMRPRD